MATKSRGVPFPLGTDANNTAADLSLLADWVNDRPGVAALTTTERNALTGAALWDGRIVLNVTTDRLNRYDAGTTTWVQIADSADIAALLSTSGLPAANALTASRGVSASAARADHVHPGGTLGYSQAVVDQGSIGGASVNLTNLSVSVTVGTGRRIRVTGHVSMDNPTTGTGQSLFIFEGAAVLQKRSLVAGASNFAELLHAEVVLTPAAGAHTYNLRGLATAGSNSILRAAADTPSFILVEDIGSA
ncbi:hypothetical protein [Nocardioides sp.]|uniref:hypothetical protein n=1 Tax=Nocardioides sp. TaxID=35761 RepID=UPI002C05D9B8|nr:hypothetical protein [Nocardioides sp.]HXH77326.1 hypothetical protein [Nocardioides sp.]